MPPILQVWCLWASASSSIGGWWPCSAHHVWTESLCRGKAGTLPVDGRVAVCPAHLSPGWAWPATSHECPVWVLSSPRLPLGPAELGAPQSTLLSQPVAVPAQVSQMQVSLHRWGSGHPHCGLGQLLARQWWLCLSRPHPGAPSDPVLMRPESQLLPGCLSPSSGRCSLSCRGWL